MQYYRRHEYQRCCSPAWSTSITIRSNRSLTIKRLYHAVRRPPNAISNTPNPNIRKPISQQLSHPHFLPRQRIHQRPSRRLHCPSPRHSLSNPFQFIKQRLLLRPLRILSLFSQRNIYPPDRRIRLCHHKDNRHDCARGCSCHVQMACWTDYPRRRPLIIIHLPSRLLQLNSGLRLGLHLLPIRERSQRRKHARKHYIHLPTPRSVPFLPSQLLRPGFLPGPWRRKLNSQSVQHSAECYVIWRRYGVSVCGERVCGRE